MNRTNTETPQDSTGNARRRTHGHVVDCDGQRAVIIANVDANLDHMENYWAVGQIVSIQEDRNRIVGQVYKVESATARWADAGVNSLLIHIELVGEITEREGGGASFSSGIAKYPRMGAIAHRIRAHDLAAVYDTSGNNTITIGALTQERSIEAKIDLEKLMSRHFAVVGSTGVGKSTSVSLILRKIIEKRNDVRVVILDPHNEFTAAFPRNSVVKDAKNLNLPFWLFMFDELTEVIFRGQKGLDAETELLRDFVADAKERHASEKTGVPESLRKAGGKQGFTADSPVPYRLTDLFKSIDERLGQLDGKAEKPVIKGLRDRIATMTRDPRFSFMFGPGSANGDRMAEILADIFRVPHHDKQISVIDLSALPSEVVSSVVSVVCRLAFDLSVWSQGAIQTLVVCEEAHRYIPADPNAGFWPTRQAIARIAKEGRKYGNYLGIITQRPSELDQTIFSQCNTVFAMRLANQADQRIIGGAMTNGAQTSINFLSSIANRECIAFGEALKTPMRMTFETIAAADLPGSNIYKVQEAVRNGMAIDLNAVIRRMREADRKNPVSGDEDLTAAEEFGVEQRPAAAGAPQIQRQVGQSAPPPQVRISPVPPAQDMRPAAQLRPAAAEIRPATERPAAAPPSRFAAPPPPPPPMAKPAGNSLISAFRSRS
jgi:hypothetical protein